MRSAAIREETGGYKTQIGEWDTELKRLQPLLARVAVLQAQMDAANDAETRLTEISAKLEAVQALLAAETFAQDIRDQLTALEGERAQIGYDRSSHDAARQQLDTYRAFETQQTELTVAIKALPDAQAALEAATLRQERTQKALDEDGAVQEEVRNVARALGNAVGLLRDGRLSAPDAGLQSPRRKWLGRGEPA